ncbi:UNVERIFIED_CONTAM: hypothetical protein GTU68_055523, partial [Idotea baltica]|nr:hypothetical protein [Idotea baltica]
SLYLSCACRCCRNHCHRIASSQSTIHQTWSDTDRHHWLCHFVLSAQPHFEIHARWGDVCDLVWSWRGFNCVHRMAGLWPKTGSSRNFGHRIDPGRCSCDQSAFKHSNALA